MVAGAVQGIAEIVLETAEDRLLRAAKGLADGAEVLDMQVNQALEAVFVADLVDRRVYLPVDRMFSAACPFFGGGFQVEGFLRGYAHRAGSAPVTCHPA